MSTAPLSHLASPQRIQPDYDVPINPKHSGFSPPS